MTLRERIIHFKQAACSQEDDRKDHELINAMSLDDFLTEISDAFEKAGVDFNKDF